MTASTILPPCMLTRTGSPTLWDLASIPEFASCPSSILRRTLFKHSFPHISSPKVTCYGPDDQSKDDGEGHIFQRRNMPSVFPVPVPQCREDKHRHAPAQDAFVKDVVFAALPANSFAILNLFRRESGLHFGSVASVAYPAYTDEDQENDRLRSKGSCSGQRR